MKALIAFIALAFALVAHAQEPSADAKRGTWEIGRSVIAGGSVHATGGVFDVRATAGQPEADPLQPATGGAFELTGGFWSSSDAGPPTDRIFADGFD